MKAYSVKRGKAPLIHNLALDEDVNFTLWPLYTRNRTPVPIE
jgi:hypothetical protein